MFNAHEVQNEDSDDVPVVLSPVTIANIYDDRSRESYEKWLEEDFETLSAKQRRTLFDVIQHLIKLPERDLYDKGLLKVLSLKKKLNFLRLLSLGKHFNILISFLNIIEENGVVIDIDSEESKILSFLEQELQSKLSTEELPQESLLQISSIKRQFEILRLLNLTNLDRGITILKELYCIEQPPGQIINIQIFIKILTTLPQQHDYSHDYNHAAYMEQLQLKLKFLEQFNKTYLQHVITTSNELVEVLNAVPKDCWKNFLVIFDLKFLQKKISSLDDAVCILDVLKEFESSKEIGKIKDLKKFLEKTIKKHTTPTMGDKLKKYIVASPSLEPSDSHSRLMFRRINHAETTTNNNVGLLSRIKSMVLSKIRTTHNTSAQMATNLTDLPEVTAEAIVASASTPKQQQKKPRLVL